MQDDTNTQADVEEEVVDVDFTAAPGALDGDDMAPEGESEEERKRRMQAGQDTDLDDEDDMEDEDDDQLPGTPVSEGDANDGSGMDTPLSAEMDPQE